LELSRGSGQWAVGSGSLQVGRWQWLGSRARRQGVGDGRHRAVQLLQLVADQSFDRGGSQTRMQRLGQHRPQTLGDQLLPSLSAQLRRGVLDDQSAPPQRLQHPIALQLLESTSNGVGVDRQLQGELANTRQ
jgi:hypothetical protein